MLFVDNHSQTLPRCEEETISPTDDLDLNSSLSSIPVGRQLSLVLPAITVETHSGSPRSTAHSSGESSPYLDSNRDRRNTSPLVSPLQYQYLTLYSEVLAENILHESLDKVKQKMDQSQACKLDEVTEEDEEEMTGTDTDPLTVSVHE